MQVSIVSHGLIFCDLSAAAFCALKLAEKKFPSSTSLHIQLLRMQILHERALHRYISVSALHLVVAFGFHILIYVKLIYVEGI